MDHAIKVIACLVPLGALFACTAAAPCMAQTLERQYVSLFTISEDKASDGSRLFRIRGKSDGSLGVCAKPKTKLKNDILLVEIPKVRYSRGLKTGPFFDVTISAPSTVKMIVFGKKREEVWPYDRGKLGLTKEEEEAQLLATRALLEKNPKADMRDYSIRIQRATSEVICVTFFEWSEGEPKRARKYAIDVSKKAILNQSEFSLTP